MSLQGSVLPAPSNSLGFDADTTLDQCTCEQFVNQGYSFCLRYLSLGAGQQAGDLSPQEASDILTSGLALMVVQHVREPGWSPTIDLGQQDGTNAANNALSLGLPAGLNVWCDLEGVNSASSSDDVIDYCNAWYAAVDAVGYCPGLYVGCDALLSGEQLYEDLEFEHYWQSCSEVPSLPVRGYQMVQTLVSQPINGIGIDQDVTQTDDENGQAQWLVVTSEPSVSVTQ
jgi:Domain of unknown function (DUF1906)